MTWSNRNSSGRSSWKPKLFQDATTTKTDESRQCLLETPEASFWDVRLEHNKSPKAFQRSKGNKCPKKKEGDAEAPTWNQTRSSRDWLEELPVRLDDVVLGEVSQGRTRRCSSSTASDASGTEQGSTSSDSQWELNELETTAALPIPPPPPLPHPEEVYEPEPDMTQMRSAHVEAILSAVILTDCANQSLANAWLAKLTPDEQETSRVERCIKELNALVSAANDTWSVMPFGSHVNGLALKGSDLDATCFTPESHHEDPGGSSAVSALKNVLWPAFQAHPSFEVTDQVFSAKVPIIKLRFENSLDVDFSCHNKRPLQNTSLLRAYVQTHPCVNELILAVKTWAKAADVCGASNCKLSCYTFALMAVYFMQVDPLVRLPCLPTGAYDMSSLKPPGMLHHPWTCQLPLSVIIARFFMFYSDLFLWGDEVVSVRLGKRFQANDDKFASLSYRTSRRIHVEDPYDLKRNLHCVLGRKEEGELKTAFKEALSVVRGLGASIDRVASVPQCPAIPHQAPKAEASQNVARLNSAAAAAEEPTQEASSRERHERSGRSRRGRKEGSVWWRNEKHADTAADLSVASISEKFVFFMQALLSCFWKVDDAEEEAEQQWLHAFAFGCSAYAVFALFSGHAFRLVLALVALFSLLYHIEGPPKRKESAAGEASAGPKDVPHPNVDRKREKLSKRQGEAFKKAVASLHEGESSAASKKP